MKPPGATGAVVVGVNGDPASDKAVDWASRYASMTRRRLRVVHGRLPVGGQATPRQIVAARYAAFDSGHTLVASAISRVRRDHSDVPTEGVIETGAPAAVLLEESRKAALLVLGHRQRRFPAPAISRVVKHTGCPVVFVHFDEGRRPSPEGKFVGLVLDGSVASSGPAYFAFRYAAATALPLVIIYSSHDRPRAHSPLLSVLGPGLKQGLTGEEELTIGEFIAGLSEDFPEVTVHRPRRAADVRELTHALETAELLVLGVRNKRLARSSPRRSVIMRLIRDGSCPVAVVPTYPERPTH